MKYPIAEIFNSIQGEGVWSGTPMTFIRLAGCNVGKYPTRLSQILQLQGAGETPYIRNAPHSEEITCKHSICTSFDGVSFLCDTDYHSTMKLDAEELADLPKLLHHVCLTGGEPFMHNLSPIRDILVSEGHQVHVETSGTKPIGNNYESATWVTCSPKQGFLSGNATLVNEWKFIYSDLTALDEIRKFRDKHSITLTTPVFLTPINDALHIDLNLARRCADWLLENEPTWRLNLQLHKLLELR